MHVSKCPFTQAERQLPLEMPYAEQIIQVTNLTIPEGYTVDELPAPLNAFTEDKQGFCRYLVHQNGNQLIITYSFSSNKLIYPISEYKLVKSFWELIAEKNNEILVLKKI